MSNKIATNEELIVSNMLELESIRRILIKRGITTDEEVLQEIEKLKSEMEEKIKRNSKLN